jgi:hypothetical protein
MHWDFPYNLVYPCLATPDYIVSVSKPDGNYFLADSTDAKILLFLFAMFEVSCNNTVTNPATTA